MMPALLCALALITAAGPAHPTDGGPRDGMVRIPGGTFTMGAEAADSPDAYPRHRVAVRPFWIDRCEVTQAEYAAFCRATGHKAPVTWRDGAPQPRRERWPVTNVTWHDASAYAAWAGKRLPTEAEWEYAARSADGRTYPWGEAAPKGLAALEDEPSLGGVGRFAAGASPFGCLDMCGNVWEWVQDWYGPYPEAGPRTHRTASAMGPTVFSPLSIHAGRKYKALRGGGAIGYYGAPNLGRTFDRGRAVPYGCYDGTGFRCAADDGPSVQHAEGSDATAPAPRRSPGAAASQPAATSVTLTITEEAWVRRDGEIVRSGVPFPQGLLKHAESLALIGAGRKPVALRASVTDRWRDGSVRWALLEFAANVGAGATATVHLRTDARARRRAPIPQPTSELRAALGAVRWQIAADGRSRTVRLRPGDASPYPVPLGTDEPLFQLASQQRLCSADGAAGDITATLTRRGPAAMASLTGWQMEMELPAAPMAAMLGCPNGVVRLAGPAASSMRLEQSDSETCRLRAAGRPDAAWTRAPGWIALRCGSRWIGVAMEEFWQQAPAIIRVEGRRLSLGFDGSREAFEADRGIAKTLRFRIAATQAFEPCVARLKALQAPLMAVASPAWNCGSGALGDLAPYDLDRFPTYETRVAAEFDRWIRKRPYGFRNWGDAYLGGPYKGKNAYANLEYDIPYDFAMQFARTGNLRVLRAAVAAARHQADIDTNHETGLPWKHSPRHTETEAELGHVFVRGLIAWWHLTGDRRGLDVAHQIGLRIADDLIHNRGVGNERQIGWSLYALTAVYAAHGDERCLAGIRALIDRLWAGQEPSGRFAIRYDNRIAFFNGLAMAGLREAYDATGDERAAGMALRLAERTLGFRPEYAGRTLDSLAWAYNRTGDARFLDNAERTWETTQEYLGTRQWGPDSTLFATRYLPFLKRLGMAPTGPAPLRLTPAQCDTANGLYLTHLARPTAEAAILDRTGRPFRVAVIRHGSLDAAWCRLTSGGRTVAQVRFAPSPDAGVRRTALVPAGKPGRILRLALTSRQSQGWDIVTDRAMPRVVATRDLGILDRLVPTVFCAAVGSRIRLTLRAKGEGFHGAVITRPDGSIAALGRRFVDFGDSAEYTFTVEAPVPAGHRGGLWQLDLQDAEVIAAEGLEGYAACSRAAWFAVPAARDARYSRQITRKPTL
jgi:formylglycine-generating enzyme required for sulfatase activity